MRRPMTWTMMFCMSSSEFDAMTGIARIGQLGRPVAAGIEEAGIDEHGAREQDRGLDRRVQRLQMEMHDFGHAMTAALVAQ